MADHTENLSIRISVEGIELFKNGVKLTTDELRGLSEVLDVAAPKRQKMGDDISAISAHLDQLNSTLVSTAKTLAAAFVGHELLGMVKDMAMLNARYEELGVVQAVIGRNAGYSASEMERAALEMQKMGITMIESRNTTVQLAQAQIDLADAGMLARIAQDAAVIGATNSSEALNRMIYGIKSAQADVLRTIGINVNFDQSYKELAQTLGVATEALSEKQKMQARENAVLVEGEKLTGAYEAAMGTAGKQMRSMARYAEDLKVLRGEVFNEALTVGVMAFVTQLHEANKEVNNLANNGQLKEWGNDVADTFAFVVDSGLSAIAVIKMVGKTAGYLAAQVFSDNEGKTGEQIAAASKAIDDAYKADMSSLLNSTSALRDALAERRAAQKADADKRIATEEEYSERSIAVQKAYAGHSLAVQQAAQLALAKSMFPQEFPDKPKDIPGIVGSKDSTYENLNQQIERRLALEQAEAALGTRLSEAERYRLEMLERIAEAKNKISAQDAKELRQNVEKTAEVIRENAAREDLIKTRLQAAEMADKQIDAQARELATLMASNTALEEQIRQVGLTTEQVSRLKVQRIEAAIAQEQINLIMARSNEHGQAEEDLIARRIALLQRQRDLTAELGQAQAHDEVRRKNEADAKRFTEDLRRDLTRSLQRGFEGGKDAATALADTLGNTVKTRLTRAIAEAMLNPILRPMEDGIRALMDAFTPSAGTGFGSDLSIGMRGNESDLLTQIGLKHSGGIVGLNDAGSRAVNAAVFRGAPRFHGGGIVDGEVPIIAKRGEGVFTEGQMKALGAGLGGPQINVNVINNNASAQVNVRRPPGGGAFDIEVLIDSVDDALGERVANGEGALYHSMGGRFGLRTAVT